MLRMALWCVGGRTKPSFLGSSRAARSCGQPGPGAPTRAVLSRHWPPRVRGRTKGASKLS